MERFTFKNFATMFADDAACLEWLRNHLYPNGIFCKICDRVTKHHRVISRPSYSCDNCGHHVHPTAGTSFHKSSTSLKTWFHAIYLMASTHCGISAKQIERETGVTYNKTAWRMFHQIRKLLVKDAPPLSGAMEVNEMYHGGKRKHNISRPAVGDKKKIPVVGTVQRGGRAIVKATADIQSATLLTGFWSLIKRGISGVYHAVSQRYLQSYLDEYTFRNHRFDTKPMFLAFLGQMPKA